MYYSKTKHSSIILTTKLTANYYFTKVNFTLIKNQQSSFSFVDVSPLMFSSSLLFEILCRICRFGLIDCRVGNGVGVLGPGSRGG